MVVLPVPAMVTNMVRFLPALKNYFFKVDNYDYVRKETVIRPTFEVNVKMTDWLKFKADANMNRYYTSIEDKQLGSGYANEEDIMVLRKI